MYKTMKLGVRQYKNQTKNHTTLNAAKRYLLNTLERDRPAWIFRLGNGKERMLPGQYEVWSPQPMFGIKKKGLYVRNRRTGSLGLKPIMT